MTKKKPKTAELKTNKKDKDTSGIIFRGELIGIPKDPRLGEAPIVTMRFLDNGSVVTTLGNQHFLPSAEDMIEVKNAVKNVATVLGIEQTKAVVGAWMGRVTKKNSKKGE
jgi:hypothetical protein